MSSITQTETVCEQPVVKERKYEPVLSSVVVGHTRLTANWVKKPFSKRNFWERLATLDLAGDKCYAIQPRNPKLPPDLSAFNERLWLMSRIAPALILQAVWYSLVPENSFYHTWHPIFAFFFYHFAFMVYTLSLIRHLTKLMDEFGTFDEHARPREYIPDKYVGRLVAGMFIYTIARTAGSFILGGYNRHAPPSLGHTISWLFPIKVGLWLITLDFFFYSYHRAVHTFPFLWKYHSKHHAARHPTPLQAILGDDIQEVIEIVLIPLATSFVMPLSVHEFWIAQCVLMYIEGIGHSGVRAYWTHPLLGEVLRPFGMDLTIEDHDLHHRYGKSGRNYGKQTRIFDRIFNTISERVEGVEK